jgi:hypothetical protein
MSELRELTNAELDMVCGGTLRMSNGCGTATANLVGVRQPTPCGGGIKLVEEIIVDIVKLLEGNTGRQKAYTA